MCTLKVIRESKPLRLYDCLWPSMKYISSEFHLGDPSLRFAIRPFLDPEGCGFTPLKGLQIKSVVLELNFYGFDDACKVFDKRNPNRLSQQLYLECFTKQTNSEFRKDGYSQF